MNLRTIARKIPRPAAFRLRQLSAWARDVLTSHDLAPRRARLSRRWVSMHPNIHRYHGELLAALLPPDLPTLSFLDLGCGNAGHTRVMPAMTRMFVDIARHPEVPEPFVEADAIEFLRTQAGGYDVIFCMDVIEHLERPAGEELLRLVTARARRLAVFFTPIGPMLVNPADPTGHRAAWWPAEFEALGYRTWAFPRFHEPWVDGLTWGAFYAWRWTRPEPHAQASLAPLVRRLGLTARDTDLMDEALLAGATPAQATHWRALRDLYRPDLFPLPISRKDR